MSEDYIKISKNKYKEDGDKKPDAVGFGDIDGKPSDVALWKRKTKDGRPYFSASIKFPKSANPTYFFLWAPREGSVGDGQGDFGQYKEKLGGRDAEIAYWKDKDGSPTLGIILQGESSNEPEQQSFNDDDFGDI